MDGWRTARLTLKDVPRYAGFGVGVLTGQGESPVLAVDIDTTHPELARELAVWCRRNVGPSPERIGRAPKVMLFYRAQAAGFKKLTGPWYLDRLGGKHRIEILGDGQQFVANAIHPGTGKPYQWPDAIADETLDVPARLLPVLTDERAREVLNAFDELATKYGLERKGASPKERKTALDLDGYVSPPLGKSVEEIREYLQHLDREDYDTWIQVGMALHHEFQGAADGLSVWDEWSMGVHNYQGPEDLDKRWEGFRSTSNSRTLRWVIKTANEARSRAERHSRPRFAALPLGEFARLPPPPWIVRDLLPMAELAIVYGASGSGKTFFTFDLVLSIARGSEWRGKDVRQGSVVYIAAEGAAGLRKRASAYGRHHGVRLDSLPVRVIGDAPDFMGKEDVDTVVDEIGNGVSVTVVDTMARVAPGANENSVEDVSKLVANLQELSRRTGAMVILVHHAGKDETRGPRGSSALIAAADTIIEIAKCDDGRTRLATVTKQKDGEDGQEYAFELAPVASSEDLEQTSVVVRHLDRVPPKRVNAKREAPRGTYAQIVLQAWRDVQGVDHDPTEGEVIEAAVEKMSKPEGKDRRREQAVRGLDSLLGQGWLERAEGGRLAAGEGVTG